MTVRNYFIEFDPYETTLTFEAGFGEDSVSVVLSDQVLNDLVFDLQKTEARKKKDYPNVRYF